MANLKKWTILLFIMIGFLSSCQKDEEYMNSFTQDYTVYSRDWSIGEDDVSGIYYYCEIPESNLTQYIYNNGVMQAFLIMGYGNISPLPFNDYWRDENDYMWTEQVTCEFFPGTVTFL